MVRMMQKRLVKRGLELIGAVAVVYLMLEILESHTVDNSDRLSRNIQVRVPQADGGIEDVAVPAQELQKLQEQVRQVQREQALQKYQQQPPAPVQVQQQQQQQQQNVQAPVAAKKPAMKVDKPQPAAQKKPAPAAAAKNPPPAPAKASADDAANQGPSVNVPAEFKGKASPDLGVNTDFAKMNIPNPPLKSKGFVLPMLYFDMGPNNLFRLFRQGAVTAYEMGRTIVVPVFHRHPRMGDEAAQPFVLPIFDTNYTVDLVWPPSETIDLGALKQVLNVVSMKDFRKECGYRLDAIVQCGTVDEKRMEGIRHFQRAAGMKVMKEFTVASYEELVPNDLTSGIVGPDEYKCMGVIYGKKCLPDQDRWLATFSRIAKNFWRPLPIRKFALNFITEILGNKPYMAVHWRYESDWLDMCKPSRPKGARERNKEICRITMGLSYDDEVRTSFVQNIKDKMADYNLKQIYLASPPNNIDLIRLLNESFPGNFYYMDHVTRFAEKSEGPDFMTNNYKASFIEQEICFRSTLYLGAALSSWTQTVLTDRLSRGLKRHDSVLEVVGKGRPGFPQLVFQFPEGNFNFGGMIKGKKV